MQKFNQLKTPLALAIFLVTVGGGLYIYSSDRCFTQDCMNEQLAARELKADFHWKNVKELMDKKYSAISNTIISSIQSAESSHEDYKANFKNKSDAAYRDCEIEFFPGTGLWHSCIAERGGDKSKLHKLSSSFNRVSIEAKSLREKIDLLMVHIGSLDAKQAKKELPLIRKRYKKIDADTEYLFSMLRNINYIDEQKHKVYLESFSNFSKSVSIEIEKYENFMK